jgi:hypothetical protein
MDNVQKICHFNNTPSSQTFRRKEILREFLLLIIKAKALPLHAMVALGGEKV